MNLLFVVATANPQGQHDSFWYRISSELSQLCDRSHRQPVQFRSFATISSRLFLPPERSFCNRCCRTNCNAITLTNQWTDHWLPQ